MIDPDARYEVKNGKFLVNGDWVPIRSQVIRAVLDHAGWSAHEGPITPELAKTMLALERRISLLALSAVAQQAAELSD